MPPRFDLDAPMFSLGGGNSFTAADSLTHVFMVSPTGGGKTSGAGDTYRRALLRSTAAIPGGFGLVVLCAKKTEAQEWLDVIERHAPERMKDVRLFGPGRGEVFDPIAEEAKRTNASGLIAAVVFLMQELAQGINRAMGTQGQAGGDAVYFVQLLQTFLYALVGLGVRAGESTGRELTIDWLRDLADSAPRSEAELQSKGWHENSAMARTLAQLAAEEAASSPERRADIEQIFRYFTGTYMRLSERPKSILDSMWDNLTSSFAYSGLRELFTGGRSTMRPADAADGKILIIDTPTMENRIHGVISGLIWKHAYFIETMRRVGKRGELRPTNLWMDEYQWWAAPFDKDAAAVIRGNAGGMTILTQTIQSVIDAIGAAAGEALLSNLQVRFYGNCTGSSAKWAEANIGSRYVNVWTKSFGGSLGHGDQGETGGGSTQAGGSYRDELRPYIPASSFAMFRRGGPPDFVVDTVVTAAGKKWEDDGELVPFRRLSFRQRRD